MGELGNVELREVVNRVESHVVKHVKKHVENVENVKGVVPDPQCKHKTVIII